MKLLSITSSRAIWLISTLFLNPRGRQLSLLIPAFVERYGFSKIPQPGALSNSPLDLKFEGGTFTGADGIPVYINFSAHDDGLIADSRTSTDTSESFLVDAMTWLAEAGSLPHYSQFRIEKLYVNEVIVELSLSPRIFSDKFSKFAKRFAEGLPTQPGVPLDVLALNFGPDPTTTRRTAPFRIERVPGTSFEKNEFLCSAPLSTDEHLKWLAELEKAAS